MPYQNVWCFNEPCPEGNIPIRLFVTTCLQNFQEGRYFHFQKVNKASITYVRICIIIDNTCSPWFHFQWTYLELPDCADVIYRFWLETFPSHSRACAQKSPFGRCGSRRDMVTVALAVLSGTWQSKGYLPKSHYNTGNLSRSGCASRHTLLDAIFVLPWKTFIHHLAILTAPNKTTTPIHLQSSTHLHPLSLVPRYFPSPSLSAELRDVKKKNRRVVFGRPCGFAKDTKSSVRMRPVTF